MVLNYKKKEYDWTYIEIHGYMRIFQTVYLFRDICVFV